MIYWKMEDVRLDQAEHICTLLYGNIFIQSVYVSVWCLLVHSARPVIVQLKKVMYKHQNKKRLEPSYSAVQSLEVYTFTVKPVHQPGRVNSDQWEDHKYNQ